MNDFKSTAVISTSPCFDYAAQIIETRLTDRDIAQSDSSDSYKLSLISDTSLSDGAYRIEIKDNKAAEIFAQSISGMLNGAGYFLKKCEFTEDGFTPSLPAGKSIMFTPECSVRGAYFASHFHNFYHVAPIDEFIRYLEDLSLWGINAVMAIVPMIDIKSVDDPEKEESICRISALFSAAKKLGMKTCTILSTNGGYCDFPREYAITPLRDELGRRGNTGNMMCPNKPVVLELVDFYNADILEIFKKYNAPIDIFMTWPYDEGGCGCEKCSPWGANGFIYTSKRAFELGQKYYPNAIRTISTWTYDTPYEGEWEALTESLREDKWCDMILADSHESFPRYPLDNGVPGSLPLIAFPEISMWGLYPWGGFGANPLSERFTSLWREHDGALDGGFLYSEGIYEDINKAIIAALYNDGKTKSDKTLEDYARYEIGLNETSLFVRLCEIIESNHTLRAKSDAEDSLAAQEAMNIAISIDAKIPAWAKRAWRWRIVYIRAKIEYYRSLYNRPQSGANIYKKLRETPEVVAAFRELIALFHCSEQASDDPFHQRVRPPCD